MTTIEIKDASGKKAGDAELSASEFGIEPNVPVMHQVVRAQRASWRAGTSNTLTRGNVRGGTVFGPHPRSYAFRVNNKEVKLAMRSALSAKLADGQFTVVDGFNFEKPRTKDAKAFIQAMGFEGQRTTLVIGNEDVTTWLSFRNLEKVNVLPVAEANTYELLDNKQLVFTAEALKRIEEVLA